MKTSLTILLIVLYQLLPAQADTNLMIIEYSVGRTGTWTGNPNANAYGWGHLGFVKKNFPLDTIFSLSTGIGFFNSHEHEHSYSGQFEFKDISTYWIPYFLVIPGGIKYQRGSFFINPEMGIAYNIANPFHQFYTTVEGYRLKRAKADEEATPVFRKWTIPAMMTIGYEMKIDKVKILLGAKGYASLNSYTKNGLAKRSYYGIALMTGVKL